MYKTNDEIVVRSDRKRIPGTDEISKKSVSLYFPAPVVQRSETRMLHKENGTDEDGGVDTGTPGVRVQSTQNIDSQADIEFV